MISRNEARLLMTEWLQSASAKANVELGLLEGETLETDFGWVFFYTSKQFMKTGIFSDEVAGNAPVIVDRTLGSLHVTGTARPIAEYIEEFRRTRAMIGLSTASFVGVPADDQLILAKLPREYASFLQLVNGCVVYGGGLHIRGCCESPEWHSLPRIWIGENRVSAFYPAVKADDVPFAQDCFGDQFLIRSDSVWRLDGETGTLENLELGWREFLTSAAANPIEFLSLKLFERFTTDGGVLKPGQLVNVYPPLCTKEAANGVSLKPIPVLERIKFLADFASQIAGVSDGSKIRIIVKIWALSSAG